VYCLVLYSMYWLELGIVERCKWCSGFYVVHSYYYYYYYYYYYFYLFIFIIIIHADIKVTLSQKCIRGTVQTAVSHMTCLQSQQQ